MARRPRKNKVKELVATEFVEEVRENPVPAYEAVEFENLDENDDGARPVVNKLKCKTSVPARLTKTTGVTTKRISVPASKTKSNMIEGLRKSCLNVMRICDIHEDYKNHARAVVEIYGLRPIPPEVKTHAQLLALGNYYVLENEPVRYYEKINTNPLVFVADRPIPFSEVDDNDFFAFPFRFVQSNKIGTETEGSNKPITYAPEFRGQNEIPIIYFLDSAFSKTYKTHRSYAEAVELAYFETDADEEIRLELEKFDVLNEECPTDYVLRTLAPFVEGLHFNLPKAKRARELFVEFAVGNYRGFYKRVGPNLLLTVNATSTAEMDLVGSVGNDDLDSNDEDDDEAPNVSEWKSFNDFCIEHYKDSFIDRNTTTLEACLAAIKQKATRSKKQIQKTIVETQKELDRLYGSMAKLDFSIAAITNQLGSKIEKALVAIKKFRQVKEVSVFNRYLMIETHDIWTDETEYEERVRQKYRRGGVSRVTLKTVHLPPKYVGQFTIRIDIVTLTVEVRNNAAPLSLMQANYHCLHGTCLGTFREHFSQAVNEFDIKLAARTALLFISHINGNDFGALNKYQILLEEKPDMLYDLARFSKVYVNKHNIVDLTNGN